MKYQSLVDTSQQQTTATNTRTANSPVADINPYKDSFLFISPYGFKLNYPSGSQILQSNPLYLKVTRWQQIGNNYGDVYLADLEIVYSQTDNILSDQAFKEASITQTESMCDADGMGGSIDCRKLISIKPFVTKAGLNGYELYRKYQGYGSGAEITKDTEQYGPIYILNISGKTNRYDNFYGSLLIARPPGTDSHAGVSPKDQYIKEIKSILDTIRFDN